MSARRLVAGIVAALLVGASGVVRGADTSRVALLEPRVVNASIEGIWLDQAEVSLQIAVRSGRDLTIRSISFTDAFVGTVPVWIAPVEGDWPLQPGQEFLIPSPIRVTAYAIDALGSDVLANIVRDGAVSVRATVEVAFATPWPARLLMQPPTQAAVTRIAIRVPVRTGPGMLQPLVRLGAAVVDRMQQEAAPFLMAGRQAFPANRDVIDRFASAVATITTQYRIDHGGTPVIRSVRTAGLWWDSAILCTTREAFEPWRFDVSDATSLHAGGRHLLQEGYVHVETTGRSEPLEISPSTLERRLGKMDERSVYVLADGKPRRIRLADRDASSALTCVRLSDERVNQLPAALDGTATSAAVFALGRSGGPVWTGVAPDGNSRLMLSTPVHRHSFGSPLVTRNGIAGLVASPTKAWNARALAGAATRAPRVELRARNRVEP
jgi:hypothetical protein